MTFSLQRKAISAQDQLYYNYMNSKLWFQTVKSLYQPWYKWRGKGSSKLESWERWSHIRREKHGACIWGRVYLSQCKSNRNSTCWFADELTDFLWVRVVVYVRWDWLQVSLRSRESVSLGPVCWSFSCSVSLLIQWSPSRGLSLSFHCQMSPRYFWTVTGYLWKINRHTNGRLFDI